ncbi:hypothetical protein CHUAL_009684 [Chamberlinius hualienensis]
MEVCTECGLCHRKVFEKRLVDLTTALNCVKLCETDGIPLSDSLKNGFGDISDELGSLQPKLFDVVDSACGFDDRIRETNLTLNNFFCSPAASLFNSVNTYILNITCSSPTGLSGAVKLTTGRSEGDKVVHSLLLILEIKFGRRGLLF